MTEVLSFLAALAVLVLGAAGFGLSIHYTWRAKEWLLQRVAARMGVEYEAREPWWLR